MLRCCCFFAQQVLEELTHCVDHILVFFDPIQKAMIPRTLDVLRTIETLDRRTAPRLDFVLTKIDTINSSGDLLDVTGNVQGQLATALNIAHGQRTWRICLPDKGTVPEDIKKANELPQLLDCFVDQIKGKVEKNVHILKRDACELKEQTEVRVGVLGAWARACLCVRRCGGWGVARWPCCLSICVAQCAQRFAHHHHHFRPLGSLDDVPRSQVALAANTQAKKQYNTKWYTVAAVGLVQWVLIPVLTALALLPHVLSEANASDDGEHAPVYASALEAVFAVNHLLDSLLALSQWDKLFLFLGLFLVVYVFVAALLRLLLRLLLFLELLFNITLITDDKSAVLRPRVRTTTGY